MFDCGAACQAARRLATGAPGGLPTRRRLPACPTMVPNSYQGTGASMPVLTVSPSEDVASIVPRKGSRSRPLLDPPIVKRAVTDALVKLHPRPMMKNPVMFVVEVGAVMTTLLTVRDLATGADIVGFTFQISLWLWFTVLFANFAEAMAEGRGKAQADTLRKTKTETNARRLQSGGRTEMVAAALLRSGDTVMVEATI